MLHEVHTLNQEEIRLVEGKAMRETLMNSACGQSVSLTDCLFFDIETTGLSAETSFVFLIGCIGYEDGYWKLHQFYIRLVQEEKALLSAFFDLAENYRILVHFNGNTFDLPFIRKRAAANHLKAVSDSLISVDLYRGFSPLRKLLRLPHMNQSYLEKYVGWNRNDQMNGKEVVSMFWNYSVSKSAKEERLLLLHNHDDLLGMLRVPAMEAYFSLLSGRITSNITAEEAENQAALLLHFEMELPLPAPVKLSLPISENTEKYPSKDRIGTNESPKHSQKYITLSAENTCGQLCIPFYHGTLRYFFPDYRNYYFLPLENQAIHKSVAAYVAKEYREQARPENCFTEKNGCFLPLPASLSHDADVESALAKAPFSPALRENYTSKTTYFEYRELSARNSRNEASEALSAYARILLRSF